MVQKQRESGDGGSSGSTSSSSGGAKGSGADGKAPAVSEVQNSVPALPAAAPYQVPDNKTIAVEISKYAGYAGLVAANGGLDASENSVFFKNHGFKVKLTV